MNKQTPAQKTAKDYVADAERVMVLVAIELDFSESAELEKIIQRAMDAAEIRGRQQAFNQLIEYTKNKNNFAQLNRKLFISELINQQLQSTTKALPEDSK